MNKPFPKKLSVTETAEIMNVDPQFLRIALRQGRFNEFGTAVKMRRWVYYINAERFYAYMAGRNLDTPGGRDGESEKDPGEGVDKKVKAV